jgi:hypothetical protein
MKVPYPSFRMEQVPSIIQMKAEQAKNKVVKQHIPKWSLTLKLN